MKAEIINGVYQVLTQSKYGRIVVFYVDIEKLEIIDTIELAHTCKGFDPPSVSRTIVRRDEKKL